jgi:hypothetical protein
VSWDRALRGAAQREWEDRMKKLYLAAAILGAIVPYVFFIDFMKINGLDLLEFLSAAFVNGAAAGFSADLLVSSLVFWVFMFQQRKRVKGPNPALFIALNLCIGLSCALPAYLYAREKS